MLNRDGRKQISRSPHGERGLKSNKPQGQDAREQSLPSRGAWIEMTRPPLEPPPRCRRSPHGERGLKFPHLRQEIEDECRSPHGERGLKL